jgi:hypothetical protein
MMRLTGNVRIQLVLAILAFLALAPIPAAAQSLVALRQYQNTSTFDLLYTTNPSEASGGGWSGGGVVGYVYDGQASGTIPLHRYFNSGASHHFMTINFGELGGGGGGWTYEGACCYVLETQVIGSVPLHRWYLNGIGKHLYTTSNSNPGNANYEGVMGYVSPPE